EEVEREMQAPGFELAGRGDGLLDGLAGDEAPREAPRPAHAVARRHLLENAALCDEMKESLGCASQHLMGTTGSGEQMLDRARVVAQHDAFAHPEPSALGDDDAARFERLGRLLDRLASAADAEVGAARG